MASLAPPQNLDVDGTYKRIRAASCRHTGLSPQEWADHVRNITATVLEARVRGRLVDREHFRL